MSLGTYLVNSTNTYSTSSQYHQLNANESSVETGNCRLIANAKTCGCYLRVEEKCKTCFSTHMDYVFHYYLCPILWIEHEGVLARQKEVARQKDLEIRQIETLSNKEIVNADPEEQKIRDFMLHLKLRRLKDLTSICTKWKFETFRGYVVVYYTSRNDEECSVRFNYSKLKSNFVFY